MVTLVFEPIHNTGVENERCDVPKGPVGTGVYNFMWGSGQVGLIVNLDNSKLL